jgi:choline dehydrogenase-like flavoprotein
MRIGKTKDHLVLVRGIGIGGTTTLSAGNALRQDDALKKLGICLDEEFEEIYREIPVSADHRHLWTRTTTQMFEICRDMDLNPQPLPKMGDYSQCIGCGQCVLGCRKNAKWDCRQYLEAATSQGAQLIKDCRVTDVVIRDKKAIGVNAHLGHRIVFFPADLVILAAGGLSTPQILNNSGIECESKLFVDPVHAGTMVPSFR